MMKLKAEQIDEVVRWMNTWEQLKDTAIPIRFREYYSEQLHKPDVGRCGGYRYKLILIRNENLLYKEVRGRFWKLSIIAWLWYHTSFIGSRFFEGKDFMFVDDN